MRGEGNSVFAACVDGEQCSAINGEQIITSGSHFISIAPKYALQAEGAGSSIHGSNVTITTTNPYTTIDISSGGGIVLDDNSSITAQRGVYVRNQDSYFTMKNGTISIEKNQVIEARESAVVKLDTVTLTAQQTSYSGVFYLKGAQLQANNLVMNLSPGLFASTAISAEKTQLLLDNASINMEGKHATALDIKHEEESHNFVRNANIDIKGDYAKAVDVYLGKNSVPHSISFSGMDVKLVGDFATGFTLYGGDQPNANGVKVPIYNSKFSLIGTTVTGVNVSTNKDMLLDTIEIDIKGASPHGSLMKSTGINAMELATVTLRNSDIKIEDGLGISISRAASAYIDNSTITASGNMNAHGLVFYKNKIYGESIVISEDEVNYIAVKNGSVVKAVEGSAIWAGSILKGENSTLRNIVDVENSTLSGDRLASISYSLSPQPGYSQGIWDDYPNNLTCTVTINASNAQLFGGTFLDEYPIEVSIGIDSDGNSIYKEFYSYLKMNLQGGTEWKIHPDRTGRTRSDVSFLSLSNSHISFTAPADPLAANLYQTLAIGTGDLGGRTDVYKADHNAHITLNTYLNKGGALDNQLTDRLIINGDVSGITNLSIQPMATSPGGETSPSGNNAANEGISLVQVSGKAQADSFSLSGGYVTVGAKPYRYGLFAYGPGSKNGAADQSQRLVSGSGDYWDYRLQSVFQPQTFGPGPLQNPPAPELVPQATNYLVAPLALMQTGLLELDTLHRRLGDIRSNITQAREDKQGEYFLVGHNGHYAYRSNLKPGQYGYNADFRYGSTKLGGNIYGFETNQGVARFGLSISHGNLDFKPRHMADVEKTGFDTWNGAAYFTYADREGFYLDAIVSYGGFSGDVASKLRSQSTKIGGHNWAASLEIGKPFLLGAIASNLDGLEIQPQMQFIYQQFDFNMSHDKTDDFDVALGQHQQFLLRIGSHLTKKFDNILSNRQTSIYAKLNYIHSFKGGDNIWLGDPFRIGDFGNHIEAGLGFNVLQSDTTSFYGQAIWQQRVSNAGFSGMRFNGGLRVQL